MDSNIRLYSNRRICENASQFLVKIQTSLRGPRLLYISLSTGLTSKLKRKDDIMLKRIKVEHIHTSTRMKYDIRVVNINFAFPKYVISNFVTFLVCMYLLMTPNNIVKFFLAVIDFEMSSFAIDVYNLSNVYLKKKCLSLFNTISTYNYFKIFSTPAFTI